MAFVVKRLPRRFRKIFMLKHCFIHLPGVDSTFSAKLFSAGIRCWDDALRLGLPCGAGRAETLRAGVRESIARLEARDALWFSRALAPAEQWRLFPHFKSGAAFVDIETTGLAWPNAYITTIALYDGAKVRTYRRGENLESFSDDILAYNLLVTWNGRSFDAPFLRRSLNIPLDMAHLDLLHVYRAMGLRGGLKKVEIALGLERGGVAGIDGLDAVRLWRAYERSGDRRMLETLLAYNVADVLSLELLADHAVRRHETGRDELPDASRIRNDLNPYVPCPETIRRILGK